MTLQEMDFAILDWIQLTFRCDWLDWLMPKVTLFAELGLFWIAVALAMLLTRRHRRCGATLACGLGAGLVVGNVLLKNLVARPRPCWLDPGVDMLVAVPADYSFPSGHTLACFIAAAVLLRYDRRFGIPALCIAVAVAFSRLYLYVHFPTDVACGAALGVGIGLTVSVLFERFLPTGQGGDAQSRMDGRATFRLSSGGPGIVARNAGHADRIGERSARETARGRRRRRSEQRHREEAFR